MEGICIPSFFFLPRHSPWPWISWRDPASLAAKMSKKKSPYACKRKKESTAETDRLIQLHFLLWRREAFRTGFILYSLP